MSYSIYYIVVSSLYIHLCSLLSTVLKPQTHVLKPQVDQDSEEYVLQLLAQSELKLVALAEELASRDLDSIHKSMEDDEV